MSGMAMPRVGDVARWIRAARYLEAAQVCEARFKFQRLDGGGPHVCVE